MVYFHIIHKKRNIFKEINPIKYMKKQKDNRKEDTYSYKGWLNSDKFFKRAFGVLGYYFVGLLTIYIFIITVAFLIGFATGFIWI